MGLFDKAKDLVDDLHEKAEDLAEEHGDEVKQGIDKAAKVVDEKTGHKRTGTIESGAERAKGAVDKLADRGKRE